MRIENTPASWGWLAGLLVFLAGLLIWDVGCLYPSAGVPNNAAVRAQYDAAVSIEVTCAVQGDGEVTVLSWYGSGVIVAPDRVLTAEHVVSGERKTLVCEYQVTDAAGAVRKMHAGTRVEGNDLASLVLEKTSPPFTLIRYPQFGRKPTVGMKVCAATGMPHRTHRCGEVQPYAEPPGDIAFDVIVVPGNSGSALYDQDGNVVGIVTHLTMCQNHQFCGGRASSLEGHLGVLLER
jgi:S1-C subfamily serine protease